MKRFMLLAPLGLVAACAMPPEGVDEAAVMRFDDAVKSMGCELVTEPHFLATELQTGLTRDQVVAMVQYKVALEQAVAMESGGHRFTSGGCADAA
ncbi:hypothetical protein [Primorskyibacter sp. S187A]|uniref:hypothetical protein n=1 Tax=Primorskyibacter sp. S187A TaxID=3415130 RepID=UPI003C7BDD11